MENPSWGLLRRPDIRRISALRRAGFVSRVSPASQWEEGLCNAMVKVVSFLIISIICYLINSLIYCHWYFAPQSLVRNSGLLLERSFLENSERGAVFWLNIFLHRGSRHEQRSVNKTNSFCSEKSPAKFAFSDPTLFLPKYDFDDKLLEKKTKEVWVRRGLPTCPCLILLHQAPLIPTKKSTYTAILLFLERNFFLIPLIKLLWCWRQLSKWARCLPIIYNLPCKKKQFSCHNSDGHSLS